MVAKIEYADIPKNSRGTKVSGYNQTFDSYKWNLGLGLNEQSSDGRTRTPENTCEILGLMPALWQKEI